MRGDVTDPEYWVRQVREPVRFMETLRFLEDEDISTFLEVGPDAVLTAMGPATVPGATFVPAQRRHHDERHTLTTALARLHVGGADVDWGRMFAA